MRYSPVPQANPRTRVITTVDTTVDVRANCPPGDAPYDAPADYRAQTPAVYEPVRATSMNPFAAIGSFLGNMAFAAGAVVAAPIGLVAGLGVRALEGAATGFSAAFNWVTSAHHTAQRPMMVAANDPGIYRQPVAGQQDVPYEPLGVRG